MSPAVSNYYSNSQANSILKSNEDEKHERREMSQKREEEEWELGKTLTIPWEKKRRR